MNSNGYITFSNIMMNIMIWKLNIGLNGCAFGQMYMASVQQDVMDSEVQVIVLTEKTSKIQSTF